MIAAFPIISLSLRASSLQRDILKGEFWARLQYMVVELRQLYEFLENGLLYKIKELKEITTAVICEDCASIPSCYKDRYVTHTGISFEKQMRMRIILLNCIWRRLGGQ